MRQQTRRTAVIALLSLLASLLTVSVTAGTASAAESIPALQWGPVQASNSTTVNLTSPTGSVTVPCLTARGGSDLKTYSATGQLTQDISRTSVIDGVGNCIQQPTVDKNGGDYGVPIDPSTGTVGRNLLAYTGDTLKWKYPAYCSNDQPTQVAVGANGNIYATTYESNGVHLIGLTPNVASGQTQPAKVLDIKIQNDCSTMLYPYKYGIMLHGQSSGNGRYYSYSGKYLGQASIGDFWGERLNADGRLFVTKTVTGSYHSISVMAYDPTTGQTTWTTTASSPGADAQSAALHPMPGGGVAVLVGKQQMLSSGVPASPTVYVKTLTIINSGGQVVLNKQLPNSDAHGNAYAGTYIAADNTGKVAVVRGVYLPTGLSYPTTEPGISIQVYDSMTNTWTYSAVMSGDNSKAGGPYGYWFDSQQDYSMEFATNTLFFDAHCIGNCTDTFDRLYPVNVGGVGNDYPRSTVLTANTPAQPAPVPYVALGDSFSSGEGVTPFNPSTDVSGTDMCHRSYLAYSELTSMNPSLSADLNQGGFWACSGSQTTDLFSNTSANNVKNHEVAQVSHLNSNTKIVTLTIGGNDIGFADFAQSCVLPASWCGPGTPSYISTMHTISTVLPSLLKPTYEHILQDAPNAKVYVLDYPQVIGVKTANDPPDARCQYLNQGATPWANAQGAHDVVASIDQVISDTVTTVKNEKADYNSRLRYVPVNEANSPFAGHGICDSGSSYFQNIDNFVTGHKEYIFHPNANGQAAYARLVASAIAAG